ncbi:hypothetical protein BOTBODRAFT_580144 [Botryobasidium botryosum FD-172 SS1]|uniref:Uncharacterized protein n=1 Tax=Botryobasidium botryosum (strain FD-172 SS1) TaxID=930990 RepID=A0A067N1K8_BOTB1|nr:hypothetical protein BOTBODRAFT_580144 [Botryobasidium botryosum FD-172 SS1]
MPSLFTSPHGFLHLLPLWLPHYKFSLWALVCTLYYLFFILLTLFSAAVIIAADSFWPSFGNSGGHLIAASVVRYFQSNRGDLVRMAILEALPHDEPYAHLDEVSLEQIALNSHLAFARPESIFLLNSVA